MKFHLLCLLALLGLVACSSSNQKPQGADAETETGPDTLRYTEDPRYRYWNDLARYLGGLKPLPGSVLDSIDHRPEAVEHRRFFDAAWALKDSVSLRRIQRWFSREYPQAHAYKETVFYPFSGPDFMTIYTLYPQAKQYFLFGLEPEGRSPDLKQLKTKDLRKHLQVLRTALRDILGRTYFITSHMGGDLSRSDFNGTLPIMLAFMARQGCEVLTVDRVVMQPDGTPRTLAPNEFIKMYVRDSLVTGVRIRFRKAGTKVKQTLYYYSLDISDPYYYHQKDFQRAIERLDKTQTFLKSASYLLHWDNFSLIRNQILRVTDMLVQDDTGIAYRFLEKDKWDIRLYGRYTTPIRQFTGQFQADLNKAYIADSARIQPLDFVFGYSALKNAANILVARKKPGAVIPVLELKGVPRKPVYRPTNHIFGPDRPATAPPPPADSTLGAPVVAPLPVLEPAVQPNAVPTPTP